MHDFVIMFGLLVFGHMLMDFPLQNDFLAKAKNRLNPIPTIHAGWCLFAHAFLHAGAVYLITQNLWLAAIECISHMYIDDLKCHNRITFLQDQYLHLGFKLLYVALMAM